MPTRANVFNLASMNDSRIQGPEKTANLRRLPGHLVSHVRAGRNRLFPTVFPPGTDEPYRGATKSLIARQTLLKFLGSFRPQGCQFSLPHQAVAGAELFLSGGVCGEELSPDEPAGGAGFLARPYAPTQLAQKIREVLEAGPVKP
jgi:hypothetical protein